MSIENKTINPKPWLEHYDVHVPPSLIYPQISMVDLLKNSTRDFHDKTCLNFEDLEFTYQDVNRLSDRLAAGLIHFGIRSGDRVGIALPNSPQFVIAYFAILKAGAIVVAINPNYRPREIVDMVNSSQVEVLFYSGEKICEIEEVKEKSCLKKIVKCQKKNLDWLKKHEFPKKKMVNSKPQDHLDLKDLYQFKEENEKFPAILPENPAIFQYTGGTTGTPKAAIGLHCNLVANTTQFITWCDLKPGEETVLAAIPLYHVYGMVLALCLGIALGARIILISNPKEIEKILQSIEKYHVSFFPGVPSLYYAINQNPDVKNRIFDLHSIKVCISGSAPLHLDIKNTFESLTGGKLMEGYGLSEAPTATHCNPMYGDNRTGSIGLPLPDVECQVVKIEDDEKIVGVGQIGELLIKGPQVMWGYHRDALESEQILHNGWLHTGDIIRMDADGYFYVIDRKKSLIKVSGFQVWPNEVEQVIATHPAIQEVGVGGVPDQAHGEKVIAWVVVKPGEQTDKKSLIEWCRINLAAYKIPSELYFIKEIPKTSLGKILRRELIHQYIENQK